MDFPQFQEELKNKTLTVEFESTPDSLKLKLTETLHIRFPTYWLHLVVKQNGTWIDDSSHMYTEILVNTRALIDQDWNVTFDSPGEFK